MVLYWIWSINMSKASPFSILWWTEVFIKCFVVDFWCAAKHCAIHEGKYDHESKMFKAFDISSWTFNNLNVALVMFLRNKEFQTKRHSLQLQLLARFYLAPGFLQPPNAFSRNTATSSVKWSCSFPAPTCTPRGRPSSPRPRGHWVTGSPRMLMIPGEGMKWLNIRRPKQTV